MACLMEGGCRRGAARGLERRRGGPDQTGHRRTDPGPAGASVRLMDQPGGARADRAASRQAARPHSGAAPPAALGSDPAEALGTGQGAPARRHRSLAGHQLSGDRQARQDHAGGDLLGRRDRHLQPGPNRPLLCAQGPDPGGGADRQADHPEHDLGCEQPRPDAVHALPGCPCRGTRVPLPRIASSPSCGGWSGMPDGRWS